MHRVPTCDLDQQAQFGKTFQAGTSGHKKLPFLSQSIMRIHTLITETNIGHERGLH